jgi:hypothetical protein
VRPSGTDRVSGAYDARALPGLASRVAHDRVDWGQRGAVFAQRWPLARFPGSGQRRGRHGRDDRWTTEQIVNSGRNPLLTIIQCLDPWVSSQVTSPGKIEHIDW